MAFCVFYPIAMTDIKRRRKKYKYFIFKIPTLVTENI